MKKLAIVILFLIVLTFATVLTEGKPARVLHITSLSIEFNKTDAIFDITYDFNKFAKLYFYLIGSNAIEPKIKHIFQDFDYEIVKIGPEHAILRVKNISFLNKGYYLHNAHKFGDTIDIVSISEISTNRPLEYYNTNSTPNYFYKE